MKKSFLLVIVAALVAAALIAGCTPQAEPPKPPAQPHENATECASDVDCGVGGCSGQVCAPASKAAGIITTCEYREEYGCVKLTSCGCVEGKCSWKQNAEYANCLEKAKSQQQLPGQPQ